MRGRRSTAPGGRRADYPAPPGTLKTHQSTSGRALAAALLLGTLTPLRTPAATIGPQVPLAQSKSYALAGDVLAAGIGMRNAGSGTIDIAIPGGSIVVQAFLYWAVIDRQQPSSTGMLNGHPIAGTLIAQAGDPCWPNQNAALDTNDPIYIWCTAPT